jgi:hypothetical protein
VVVGSRRISENGSAFFSSFFFPLPDAKLGPQRAEKKGHAVVGAMAQPFFRSGRGCAVGTAELLVSRPRSVALLPAAPPIRCHLSLGGPPRAGGRPALMPIVLRVKARRWICRFPFPGTIRAQSWFRYA